MYVLLTRPKNESEELAEELFKFGMQVIIDPLLLITKMDGWEREYNTIKKNEIALIIFTSSNAIREFSSYEKARNFDIAVVGRKSEFVAKNLGYKNIQVADGSALSLYSLMKEEKRNGKILYVAGDSVTLEIADKLNEVGVAAKKIVVYKSSSALNLSHQTMQLLIENKINSAIFFSTKTAQTFVDLVKNGAIKFDLSSTKVFALSEKIAKVVSSLSWYKIYIANDTTSESVISLIKQHIYEQPRKKRKIH